MNTPILVSECSYQIAWAKAITALKETSWSAWNVIVQINNPNIHNDEFHSMLIEFAKKHGYLTPKQVEHTIFPTQFYKKYREREQLYRIYWKFFRMAKKMPHSGWGTYFERMIHYESPKGYVDQLGDIIDNINKRNINYQASHTIVIPYPHRDHNKLMGAPCLNYLTIQVENSDNAHNGRIINILAVYRNHDFTIRTYGNYLGLCNLLKYICIETNSSLGALTCISSHAYVPNNKNELLIIANKILEYTNE